MPSTENVVSIEMSKNRMITLLLSSVILFIVALLLWKQQTIDNDILIAHNPLFANEFYLRFFKYISKFGMGAIAVVYSLLVFLSSKNKETEPNRPLFLYIIFCFAFTGLAGDLLKEVFDRARPVIELAGKISQTELNPSPSFPSGHAAKSMGLALPFVIMALNRNTTTKSVKFIVLVLATLVSYSRIALQKHFLSDVVVSIAIALLFVLITRYIVNLFYKKQKMDEAKLSMTNKRLGFIFIGLAALLCII